MSQRVQRIEKEFVFSNLLERKTPLEVHAGTLRVGVVMTENSERQIRLVKMKSAEHRLRKGQEVSVYFRFRGKPMTFKSWVLDFNDESIVVRQPEYLYRELSRGFERIVHPRGLSVSFMMQGEQVNLNYPASETYEPVEPPDYDPGFDATKIADLMKNFRERAREYASESKIIMFRERQPQTMQELLVARSGRMLVVPLYGGDTTSLSPTVRERLLSQDDIVEIQKEAGNEPFGALEELRKVSRRLNDEGIHRELYCPVLYHQYVVGYLYLMKGGGDVTEFSPKALEFTVTIARILAYALQVNGYFREQSRQVEYDEAELIDISGSGVLFSYPKEGPTMSLYADIDLQISIEDRKIHARGRVMRKFGDSQRTYFGVQFTEINAEDMSALFDRLYGEEYRGGVDESGLAEVSDPEADQYG